MTWGKRKAGRVVFQHLHAAHLVAADGSWRRACTLCDISSTGAQLEIEGSAQALTEQNFFLVLTASGAVARRCALVRVAGSTVGVRFLIGHKPRRYPGF